MAIDHEPWETCPCHFPALGSLELVRNIAKLYEDIPGVGNFWEYFSVAPNCIPKDFVLIEH